MNVFLQKVVSSFTQLYCCDVLIVPTIKNAKTNGDQPLSNGAVCKTAPLLGGSCKDNGDPVDNGEKINASEEKLKDMMMEMNQTLNMLTATDFSTSQVVLIMYAYHSP